MNSTRRSKADCRQAPEPLFRHKKSSVPRGPKIFYLSNVILDAQTQIEPVHEAKGKSAGKHPVHKQRRQHTDASIQNVVPNDLTPVFESAQIRAVYANGSKSYELYQKYIYPRNGRKIVKLPSTSPANAAFSLERLVEQWKIIKEQLE